MPREDDPPASVLAVLDDFGLTAVQFRVVCHLARRFNAEKRCAWPGRESMWQKCRINEKTLGRAIRDLVQMKIITIEHVDGSQNRYRFNPPSQWIKPTLPKLEGTPSNNPPQSEGQEPPQTSGHPAPQTELYHPPQSEGHKGIKEGNQISEPVKAESTELVVQIGDSQLALATPRTREARKVVSAVASLPGFSREELPNIEQLLYDVRDEREMTTEGIILAFTHWIKGKARFLKTDNITALSWRTHFDGWLDNTTGKGGSGYIRKYHDAARFGELKF